MRKMLRLALLALMIFLGNCSQEFIPDFYAPDSEAEGIYNEDNNFISCSDPEIEKYKCLHDDKIAELKKFYETNCNQYSEKSEETFQEIDY